MFITEHSPNTELKTKNVENTFRLKIDTPEYRKALNLIPEEFLFWLRFQKKQWVKNHKDCSKNYKVF